MIELNVEPYCQKGCRMFSPKVLKSFAPDTQITVECEWKSQCRYLHNYLKSKGDCHDQNQQD